MKTLHSDLERFSSTILSLVPYSHHPRLDDLIRKIEKQAKESERFLIKMEVKRLSQPCSRIIDLREMFPDSEPVHYNNLCHFLDAQSKDVFFESIDRNGGMYTIYLYESIMEKAKKRYADLVKKNDEKNKSVSVDKGVKADIELIPLINTTPAQTQKCEVGSQINLYSKDPANIKNIRPFSITDEAIELVSVTSNVLMVDLDQQSLHDCTDVVFATITNHTGGLIFKQNLSVAVNIQSFKVFKKGGKEKVRYYLTVNRNKTRDADLASFKQYLLAYEKAKRTYFETLVPALSGNVSAKAYEQFITANNSAVTVLMARFREYHRPSVTLKTKTNKDFMERIEIDSHHGIEQVLLSPDLQSAIGSNKCFRHIGVWLKLDTSYWLSLENYLAAYTSGFISKLSPDDVFFIDIEGKPVSPLKTYRHEQVVPDEIAQDFDVFDHKLSSDVSALLQSSSYQITLSERADIKRIFNDIIDGGNVGSVAPFDERDLTPLPETKYRSPAIIVDAQLDDIRREDRFLHEFPVNIVNNGKKKVELSGKTINISSKGLCIQVDNTSGIDEGSEIAIDIDMSGVGGPVVENQSYLVLGKSPDNCIRLVVNQNPKKHKASRFLKKFILRDAVKLLPSGADSSRDFQLSKSLRTVFARNLDSIPFYVQKSKTSWSVSGVSMVEGSSTSIPLLPKKKIGECFNHLAKNAVFRSFCAKLMSHAERLNVNQEAYLIVMPITIAGETSYYMCSVDDVFKNKKHKEFFSEQVMKGHDIAVLSVNISKTRAASDKFYRDEMDLLHTINQSASSEIRDEINSVSFLGGIRDVTSAFMPILIDSAL